MSHDAPIYGYEWFQKVENALKEMRVGYDLTVMRDTANGFFQNVMTFVSDHQSELLYSASGVSLGIMALYLLWKWTNAEDALQRLSEDIAILNQDREDLEFKLKVSRDSRTALWNRVAEVEDDLEEAREGYNEMEISRDFWKSEASNKDESIAQYSEWIDNITEERDDLESDRADMESDRDWWIDKCSEKDSEYEELEEKVETLEAMVDTYKTLVSEMESTTELRLAA